MTTMAERHLAQAERHLTQIGEGLARQRLLVTVLEADGHDASLAYALLATMEETQRAMLRHQTLILDEIAAARGKPSSP
jgi:hypothetical protein